MTAFSIIPARAHHCGQMVRLLRTEQAQAVARLGVDSHKELRARFDASSFRRAWMIDGKLAGIGGVTGTKLSWRGYVWLALANAALPYRMTIVREARRQLDEIMGSKRELLTTILDGDEASKRFAIFLGFVVIDGAWLDAATSRTARRELMRLFEKTPEARVEIGNGFGVAMKYGHQREAA